MTEIHPDELNKLLRDVNDARKYLWDGRPVAAYESVNAALDILDGIDDRREGRDH